MKNFSRRLNYIKNILLNELLNGQDIDYVTTYRDNNLEIKFNVDFDNLYLITLGLPRDIYQGDYKMNASEYLGIFDEIREFIKLELSNSSISTEVILNLYDNSKKIIIFATPNKKISIDKIKEVTANSNKYLSLLYNKYIANFKEKSSQLAAISNHITSWQEVKDEFDKVNFCSYLSFFTDELEVIDSENYYKLYQPFSYMDLNKLANEIVVSVLNYKLDNIALHCDDLFLNHLKHTFDSNLCNTIVLKLKMEILERLAFNNNDFNNILKEEKFQKIEYLNEHLKALLIDISERVKDVDFEYNIVIKKALEYIHANYYKKIYLAEIAEYTGVVPQHLSKVFNKEMNQSVPVYINNLRVEKAKMLLATTTMKSSMISNKAGFESPRRFGQIFKEIEGVTPLDYRKKIISDTK